MFCCTPAQLTSIGPVARQVLLERIEGESDEESSDDESSHSGASNDDSDESDQDVDASGASSPSGNGINDIDGVDGAEGGDDDAMDAEDSNGYQKGRGGGKPRRLHSSRLAALQRRANFSVWLQRQVLPAAEASLGALLKSQSQSPSGGPAPGDAAGMEAALAQLLTAHQTGAAAALAASIGDVRLAALIAQSGKRAAGKVRACHRLL